jgi:hypothetical protein
MHKVSPKSFCFAQRAFMPLPTSISEGVAPLSLILLSRILNIIVLRNFMKFIYNFYYVPKHWKADCMASV